MNTAHTNFSAFSVYCDKYYLSSLTYLNWNILWMLMANETYFNTEQFLFNKHSYGMPWVYLILSLTTKESLGRKLGAYSAWKKCKIEFAFYSSLTSRLFCSNIPSKTKVMHSFSNIMYTQIIKNCRDSNWVPTPHEKNVK